MGGREGRRKGEDCEEEGGGQEDDVRGSVACGRADVDAVVRAFCSDLDDDAHLDDVLLIRHIVQYVRSRAPSASIDRIAAASRVLLLKAAERVSSQTVGW